VNKIETPRSTFIIASILSYIILASSRAKHSNGISHNSPLTSCKWRARLLKIKLKNLAKIILLIVAAAFFVVFLVFYRPVALLGDTYYEPVYTGSMEPAIPVGSIVIIKPVDPETLKIGDIICFQFSESTSVTHRIINITNEGFITKGDANEDPDTWTVQKENVIGKVTTTIPYIGYLGYFVRTPLGFITLVIIPASILIVLETRKIIIETKKTKKEVMVTPQFTISDFLIHSELSFSNQENNRQN
jgi:signal peptidase